MFLPVDTALLSESGVGLCQVLSTPGPRLSFQSWRQSTVCGWLLHALLLPGWAKLLSKAGFYQQWVQVCISKCPKLPQGLPQPISSCWPAVNLKLVSDYFWEGFWKKPGWGSRSSRGGCLSDFRDDGGRVPLLLRHSSESVQDYFPVPGKGGALSRLPEPRVWVCQMLGECFCGSPMRGKHQSASQDSTWIGCPLKPVSDNPWVFVCCCLLSKS